MFTRILRYTAFGILTLVLAGLITVSYLVLTFEPDDYRDELIDLVEEKTGRAFSIGGSLELHLDPPLLGFEVHDIAFDNPPGFGQEPMLTAKRIEAYLQVIPFLLGKLRINSVRLDGLQLRLRRKSSGHTNWSDLFAADDASESGPGSRGRATGLDLAEVRLTDSTIAIWDELRNRRLRGSDLNLNLTNLSADGSMHVELDGELMAWLDTRAEKPNQRPDADDHGSRPGRRRGESLRGRPDRHAGADRAGVRFHARQPDCHGRILPVGPGERHPAASTGPKPPSKARSCGSRRWK